MASEQDKIEWEFRVREFAFAIAPLVKEHIANNRERFEEFLRERAAEERRKKALCPAAEHNEEQPNSVESRTDGGEEQQNSGEARKKIKAPARGKEKVK